METRIIRCQLCKQHLWVATTAKSTLCVACKQINSLPSDEQSSRTFRIRDRAAKTRSNISSTSGSKKILSRTTSSSDARTPRKRALLCGVSYKRKKYQLKGTINDVMNMRELLKSNFRFPEDCIRQLTEEEKDPNLIPTRKNIENGLQWLVEGCRSGDSLVFYFAGHGSQELDFDSDEVDGLDETICPVDFEENGKILDDYINSTIVRPLVEGVTLHAIIDSCHSATMLDLPYVFSPKEKKWVHNQPPSGAHKGTSAGLAICISACRDDQKALDSSSLDGKTALTCNFIREIKTNPRLTYAGLMTRIQNDIDEAIEALGVKGCIVMKVFNTDLSQETQLSSSEKFDIYSREFKL